MARDFLQMSEGLRDYVRSVSLRESALQRRLREETAQLPGAAMQISPEQGQLMALLARLVGARRYLEVGTFTGYSSLAVALALPPDGRILCCDVSREYTDVARRYWQEAGVADRIELVVAPATETLQQRLAAGEAGAYDLAFIDADKSNYDNYYEAALRLVRKGGLILIDNVLWSGAVADPARNDADTAALKALNAKLHHDERIDLALVAVADGITFARVR